MAGKQLSEFEKRLIYDMLCDLSRLLIESITRYCQTVTDANGYSTKYEVKNCLVVNYKNCFIFFISVELHHPQFSLIKVNPSSKTF